jgi:hypothetical protein
MSRRLARVGCALALLAGVLGGCGIPDHTEVVVVGAGPSDGLTTGEDEAPTRVARESITDRTELIERYLQAAAGGDLESAAVANRVREFIDPSKRDDFKLATEIRVVRLGERPLNDPGSTQVELRNVQQVGVLSAKGTLDPPIGGTANYDFQVSEVRGEAGLFITKMPDVLLLSDTALNTYYTRRTIYFWNNDYTALVPDVRYMSTDIPAERQPTQIIRWLADDPSPWLAAAVKPLPDNTKVEGNVFLTDGKLQVNLSGVAFRPDTAGAELERLSRQIMWSLRPYVAPALEIRFDNQSQGTFSGTDYLTSNPSYRFAENPERFAVYNGQIRRLAQSVNPTLPVPGVPPELNKGVISAALSTNGTRTYAALVTQEKGARQSLKVGSTLNGQAPVFRKLALPGTANGRPVWAVTPDGADTGGSVGLVVVDRRIYSFGAGTTAPRRVSWPNGPALVDAVSVAADGHRVAVVAEGRLHLSVLTTDDSGMTMSVPREVPTQLQQLTAVDWSSEGSVVVAGTGSAKRRAIADVSIDGAVQTNRQPDLGEAEITHLVAYPANPVTSVDANSVAYMARDIAYDVLGAPKQIGVADLAGPTPSPVPGQRPVNPFFLN